MRSITLTPLSQHRSQDDVSTVAGHFADLVRLPWREAQMSYQFIRRDLSSTMIPAFIFMLAAMKEAWPLPVRAAGLAVGHNVLYFWLYIYTFCLANQIVGVDEDRINKPDRPIPSGLTSLRGAWTRWIVTMVMFTAVSWWFGVMRWALLWQATTVLLAFGGMDKHWFTKNPVTMSIGVIAQLAAAWQMVTPLTSTAWWWIIVVAIFGGMPNCIQDFRDVAGDSAKGRKTLPIVLGDRGARRVVSTVFAVCVPALIHFGLIAPRPSPLAIACDVVLALLSLSIAVRVARYRSPKADHETYMLYTYMYCTILACAVVLV